MVRPAHEQLAEPTHFNWFSEPAQGEISIRVARPRWRRMLRAAALLLSKTLSTSGTDEDVWIFPDAIGGWFQADFSSFLLSLLTACGLGDEDSGTVLISMYTFLQADDLPMTAQTWRALTVTATLASVKGVLSDRTIAARAEARLREAVVHWWPKANADKALRVFTHRPKFRQHSLTSPVFAECYYTLREKALQMGDDEITVLKHTTGVFFAKSSRVSMRRRPPGSGGSALDSSAGGHHVNLVFSDVSSAMDEEIGRDPRPHDVRKSAHTILL